MYAAKVTPSIHSLSWCACCSSSQSCPVAVRNFRLCSRELYLSTPRAPLLHATLFRCNASALRPSWRWPLSLPSRLSLYTQLRTQLRPLLSLLQLHTPRPTFGHPTPRVPLAAVKLRKMEDTEEVYTAMILAPTGRCSVVMTGRGRFGTTIRTGQSKFIGSTMDKLGYHIDADNPVATDPSAPTRKAFGPVSEAAPQKSTAWRLPTQARKMLP